MPRYRFRVALAEKFHPDRLGAVIGKMAAIVADVLDEPWTDPPFQAMSAGQTIDEEGTHRDDG